MLTHAAISGGGGSSHPLGRWPVGQQQRATRLRAFTACCESGPVWGQTRTRIRPAGSSHTRSTTGVKRPVVREAERERERAAMQPYPSLRYHAHSGGSVYNKRCLYFCRGGLSDLLSFCHFIILLCDDSDRAGPSSLGNVVGRCFCFCCCCAARKLEAYNCRASGFPCMSSSSSWPWLCFIHACPAVVCFLGLGLGLACSEYMYICLLGLLSGGSGAPDQTRQTLGLWGATDRLLGEQRQRAASCAAPYYLL